MTYLWLKCCKNCLALCSTQHELYTMKRICNQCIDDMCFKRHTISIELYQYLYLKIGTIYAYYSQFVK